MNARNVVNGQLEVFYGIYQSSVKTSELKILLSKGSVYQ